MRNHDRPAGLRVIRLLAEAEAELDESVRYYDRQREGLGADFAAEVGNAVARIERYPLAWQRLSDRIRRIRLTRFPFGLVYAVLDAEIVVIAVMHLSRKPGYWQERIDRG